MTNDQLDDLDLPGDPSKDGRPLDSVEPAKGAGDARFNIVVAVLLVLIMASLSGLWLIERNRRVRAERALADFQGQQLQAQALLSQFAAAHAKEQSPGPAGAGESFRRESLESEAVVMEGKDRTMFKISPDAGEKLGFRAGDIIFVADRPAKTIIKPTGPESESRPAAP